MFPLPLIISPSVFSVNIMPPECLTGNLWLCYEICPTFRTANSKGGIPCLLSPPRPDVITNKIDYETDGDTNQVSCQVMQSHESHGEVQDKYVG